MNGEDQVTTVVATALKLSVHERRDYIRAACEGDDDLLQAAAETLEWEERMGGFLRKPLMSLPDLEHPFKPGEVVNHRFEIVREIGEGGMGVVYEAFDRKREQRIAVKSAKIGFRRLLSPELESALKVRHPNICLVNEIHTASTDQGEVDFLTMEFLEGPTLQDRLDADGALERKEAVDIARQICAGLAEAHRIGIIHKDLKPSNVILSPAPDGSCRVVITDFGLAGEPNPGHDLAGTPRFMAPELWRGSPASQATDLYALGVILEEMCRSNAGKRMEALIARCLDPDPAARPRDAAEVLAALSPQSPRRAPLLVAIALLAVIAGVTIRGPLAKWLAPAGVRLAILPVDETSVESAIVNGALNDAADRLTNRKEAPTLVVIRPSQNAASDVRTPEQARRIVDATHALQITWRREGDTLVTRGAVIDLATQTRLREIAGRYPISSAGDLPTALSGAVSRALGLRGETAEPIAPAATTAYLQGLAYLRRDQHSFDAAIPLFRRAMSIDRHSPLPPARLVEALVLKHKQTNDGRLLAVADRALQTAEALNPDSVAVLLAAGRLHAARGNYEEALKSYTRVAERQPRDVEVLLRIAEVHQAKGLRKEAIESYQKAIALDPDYYATYQELGVFHYRRGEYAQAAEQFRRVIERAPGFYNAHTNLGATLSEMGQDDAAVEALLHSLKIRETGRALNSLAAIRAYQKRDDEAVVHYRKALALDPGSYICLLNLGDSCRRLGLDAESREYYLRGSELAFRALQNNPRDGATRAYAGYLTARLGDRLRGRQEIEQALQFAPNDKLVIRRAVLLYEMLGERDRALALAETATTDVLRELDRHPDLADFRRDSRFREWKAKKEKEG